MPFSYNPWDQLLLYQSASTSQKLLKNVYQVANYDTPDVKSFDNCYPFLYYLDHGKVYYEQAKIAPLLLKPLLLFYGLVHLLKACLLTVDPFYPESTSVLAHGVSTRKRKKQQYAFVQDEVKIQKNGLLTHFSDRMFHVKHLEGEKFNMDLLFKNIPELSEHYYFLKRQPTFLTLTKDGSNLNIPTSFLDGFNMTEDRAKNYLENTHNLNTFLDNEQKKVNIQLEKSMYKHTIVKFDFNNLNWVLPSNKSDFLDLPEVILHYLLLYNLSMIARYETEWWSELNKTRPNDDFPFISTFLSITENKSPFLISSFLQSKIQNL